MRKAVQLIRIEPPAPVACGWCGRLAAKPWATRCGGRYCSARHAAFDVQQAKILRNMGR